METSDGERKWRLERSSCINWGKNKRLSSRLRISSSQGLHELRIVCHDAFPLRALLMTERQFPIRSPFIFPRLQRLKFSSQIPQAMIIYMCNRSCEKEGVSLCEFLACAEGSVQPSVCEVKNSVCFEKKCSLSHFPASYRICTERRLHCSSLLAMYGPLKEFS